jgi:predicted Zn finger-like uncharacterized protein
MTMFKVVPDQLKISQGWVRCGQCFEVFDASAHLQSAATVAKAPVDHRAPQASQAKPEPAAATGPESEAFGLAASSEIDEGLLSQMPDSAQIEAEALALQEHPLDQPFELRRQDIVEESDLSPSQVDSALEPDSKLHGELTFVRKARRQAFWRRPAVRAAMLITALVLALLLVLQVAVQDRDRLAAAEPSLRPWLFVVCRWLDCTVGPPRRIDAIAIESTSFNRLRPDTYRLQVTLKNQAATEVAMPALELSLTDAQERTVVRRVLVPGEFGATSSALAPASEWSSSIALAVTDSTLGGKIAGYRLLAFYP